MKYKVTTRAEVRRTYYIEANSKEEAELAVDHSTWDREREMDEDVLSVEVQEP